MGCDIHLVLEQRDGDEWIAVDTFGGHHRQNPAKDDFMDGYSSPIARSRNYARFAKLAGVRGDGPEPRGLPDDISQTTRFLTREWGVDGHSHSWLSLADAAAIWLATEHQKLSDFSKKYPESYFFNADVSEGAGRSANDLRVVFWFDN